MHGDPVSVLVVVGTSATNRALIALVDHLPTTQIRLAVACVDDGRGPLADELRARGFDCVGLGAPGWRRLPLAVWRLRALVGERRPAIVHSHLFAVSFVTELMRLLVRRPPASALTRHHNLEHHRLKKPLHVAIDRWCARRATAVVAVSEAVASTLVAFEGIPADKVRVVVNAFDWDVTTADPVGVDGWRTRLGPGPLLLSVGRIEAVKDLPTTLRALASVAGEHPAARLAIAGCGSEEEETRLRRSITELQLDGQVLLLGHVDGIFDLMAAADVFVQASLDEAFGQTIAEAMSLGVPVVTTTSAGQREVVGPDYPELASGDDASMAARIREILDDPVAARRVAADRAVWIRRRFTAADNAADLCRLYLELDPSG